MTTIYNLTQTQLSLGFCNLYVVLNIIFPSITEQSKEMKSL